MGLFKSAIEVAAINFRRWVKDIRVRFVLLFITYMLYIYLSPFVSNGIASGESCSGWFLTILFQSGNISIGTPKVIFHIGMLLILCDAPFFSSVSPYMILRSRRDAWWMGECIYIIGAALAYTLFLSCVTILFLLPVITLGNEWGGLLKGMVFGDAKVLEVINSSQTFLGLALNPDIVRYLYPQGAQLYVFMAVWCSFSFLGLLMYLISMVKRNVLWGMSVAAIFILLDPFVTWVASTPKLYWLEVLSPVIWTSIDQMKVINRFNIMSMPLALGMYVVLITILVILIARYSRKIMIDLK